MTVVFTNAGSLWFIWIASGLGLIGLSAITRRQMRLRKSCCTDIGTDEESGTSYMLGFVLTVPLYLLLVALILEASLLLMSKVGTVYAAYAGARSVAVFEPFGQSVRDRRSRQAVVSGLLPFVSSGDEKGSRAGAVKSGDSRAATEFADAVASYSQTTIRRQRVEERYRHVGARTTIEREVTAGVPREVTLTVSYRAPLNVPGVARFFDEDGAYPYERTISTSVTMAVEVPRSDDESLGISYRPR